jgi:hypothetical protein
VTTVTGYNGWTNYETWRTNLELLSKYDVGEFMGDNCFAFPDDRDDAVDKLAAQFEDDAHNVVEEQATGWALDLARGFLSRVDWREIASHYVDNYAANLASR